MQELCLQTVAGHDLECMQLVELFGRHLITKAVGGPLRITDVVDGSIRWVRKHCCCIWLSSRLPACTSLPGHSCASVC
jgi:hypothetical protein